MSSVNKNTPRSWSDVAKRLSVEEKKTEPKTKETNPKKEAKAEEHVEELLVRACQAILEKLRVSEDHSMWDSRNMSHLSPLSDLCSTPEISDEETSMYEEVKEADDEEVRGSTSLALLLSHFNSDVINYEDLMALKRGDEGFLACFHDWLSSETVGEAGTHVYASDNQPINITTMYEHMYNKNQLLDLTNRRLVEET